MNVNEIKFVLPLEFSIRLGESQMSHVVATGTPAPEMAGLAASTESYESVASSRPDYSGREGYDAAFLTGLAINLEDLLKDFIDSDKLAPLLDAAKGSFLKYTHFSTAQHRQRRMTLLTAVNIRGKAWESIKRTKDVWILDSRMDAKFQTGPAVYKLNDLDRGHMVRRQDPDWGSDALLANEDTFHYTNSCPQHKNLNQKEWNVLEDYILKAATDEALDVSVFTGPVFSENDLPYRGVLLPLQFWKIAAMIKRNGTPSVSGFVLSQAEMLGDVRAEESIGDTGFTTYQTYQVSLEHIAKLTGITFDGLFQYDPLNGKKAFESAGFHAIKSSEDIVL